MLVEVKEDFISKQGHFFGHRYIYNAMLDGNIYRLQAKYNRSIRYLPITKEEFTKYFLLIDDKSLRESYVA